MFLSSILFLVSCCFVASANSEAEQTKSKILNTDTMIFGFTDGSILKLTEINEHYNLNGNSNTTEQVNGNSTESKTREGTGTRNEKEAELMLSKCPD